MENNYCIICQKVSNVKLVKVSRGLDNLRKCAENRNDETIIKILGPGAIIYVHETCRKHNVEKRKVDKISKISNCDVKKNLRSSVQSFDFKNVCLFCCKSDSRKSDNKLHKVTTIEFKCKILELCDKRGDKLSEDVKLRISNELDLVASESRYHKKCFVNFNHLPKDIIQLDVSHFNNF